MKTTPSPPKSPLQQVAEIIYALNYADLNTLARDLHSDSDSIGKTPIEITALLARWAARQLGHPTD